MISSKMSFVFHVAHETIRRNFFSSVNTKWNSVPGNDKYKVVLLRLNENNLGIDIKTRDVKGQMAP